MISNKDLPSSWILKPVSFHASSDAIAIGRIGKPGSGVCYPGTDGREYHVLAYSEPIDQIDPENLSVLCSINQQSFRSNDLKRTAEFITEWIKDLMEWVD